ncbi:MAG: glycosyltransferase [Alphaproteobacteria bacterium]|nr:glycosyltransferase [Alphaproteobacteria bacterium]
MRIAVHDYAGHPFQFELSRELARNGHEVRHFFFSDFETPKGRSAVGPDDAPTFSVDPITLGGAFDKGNFVSRGMKNMQYGREAGRRIATFKPDVVLSGNTPTESQGFLIDAAQSNGAAFAFWMQDFYSLAVGLLLKKRLGVAGAAIGAAYRAAERGQIARSDAIVVISDGFTEELVRFGGSPQKVTTIPNWGALSELPVRAKDNAWSRARDVQDKFVFLYSGTLGLKHDPRLLLRLADAYADDPSVVVLVAAEGAGVDTLKSEVARKPRANMIFAGLQPIADFPDVLGAADVFITLLEEDAGRFSVPSKVLSYLCAARPILLAAPANNLSVEVVKTAGAGVAVAAGDANGFVEAARLLHGDPARRAAAGEAGRAYAERHFDIGAIAQRFEQVFAEAIARRKGAPGPAR